MVNSLKEIEVVPYKSAFNSWDQVASVRSKPGRILHEEETQGAYFFTPELVPVSQHPLVQERGEETVRKLLIYHLYTHLDFTENLEHEVVNYVAYKIGRRNSGYDIPPGMIEDAWKLYVDEAYHFMFSADLMTQVHKMTGVAPPVVGAPKFLRELQQILGTVPSDKRDLVYTFFSTVSETLITGTLGVVPQDERVVKTVREVIGDHAEDEGRHHAYFANLLKRVWGTLSEENQKLMGPLFPKFIYGFLEPDYEIIKNWLRHLDFSPKEIERIIEESYPKDKVIEDIRGGAKITLRHIKQTGILKEKYTEEVFEKHGLLVE